MTRATHSHKMPAQHVKEMLGIIIVFAAAGAIFNYVLHWQDDNGMLVTIGIGFALALLLFILGVNRRRNTTLIAEMDEKNWAIKVWMRKPVPAWKGKLNKASNGMNLENITGAYAVEINKNETLVLRNEGTGGQVHIPSRIAKQPEVQAFFVSYFDTKEGQKLSAKDVKEPILKFLEG